MRRRAAARPMSRTPDTASHRGHPCTTFANWRDLPRRGCGSEPSQPSETSASSPSPAQDPQGAERVPAARPTIAVLEREIDLPRMAVLELPAPVRVSALLDDFDGLGQPRIGRVPIGRSKVLEAAQEVVEVPGRERELEPGRVDDLAGRFS